jgi:quercetin 2,3-dioxygenase
MADAVLHIGPLWEMRDPFLFCAHHFDAYPAGNEHMGPVASLAGRQIGQDFAGKDGWNMYHGDVIPGFPYHPHRGFETVTIVRKGRIDHFDSLGATARFGDGDVQWLTAGGGILHSEMFPLRNPDGPNPLELFQIWLNLPQKDKLVDPYFSMFWAEKIPTLLARDDEGRSTTVSLTAGSLGELRTLPPPPNSWAARPESDLAIWTIAMEPGARWTLPAAKPGTTRSLYFFEGTSAEVDGVNVQPSTILLRPDVEVSLVNGPTTGQFLLLQGRPLDEPIARYGPFVMNTEQEIRQAFEDYRRTEFGGWQWPTSGPVHPREAGRFAKHADGKVEEIG